MGAVASADSNMPRSSSVSQTPDVRADELEHEETAKALANYVLHGK